MKRNEIASVYADAQDLAGTKLTVCGWIRTMRQSKSLAFIELNDGSCHRNLQIIAEEQNLNNFEEICRQNVGAALCIEGDLVLTPEAKQPCELHATSVYVEGTSTPDYPLQKKRHSME
ncbi:MAG: asparagine--tRNA ligase, partial [Clostridia bacterium]|nr:asparagine--tRNA ligase [Clostridia bacterium]